MSSIVVMMLGEGKSLSLTNAASALFVSKASWMAVFCMANMLVVLVVSYSTLHKETEESLFVG
jgi:hypothetical protein